MLKVRIIGDVVIMELMHDKGLALDDIVKGLHKLTLKGMFPVNTKAKVIEDLSEIEYRLSLGGIEKIQVAALIGIFNVCK